MTLTVVLPNTKERHLGEGRIQLESSLCLRPSHVWVLLILTGVQQLGKRQTCFGPHWVAVKLQRDHYSPPPTAKTLGHQRSASEVEVYL